MEPFKWLKPCLKPSDMFVSFHRVVWVLTLARVYIGLRDLDAAEKNILKEHGIKSFTMHEVDKYGIGKIMEMALEHVNPGRDRPTHLSFDVDALDPTVAPSESCVRSVLDNCLMDAGTGTPVRGGLSFREGEQARTPAKKPSLLVGEHSRPPQGTI